MAKEQNVNVPLQNYKEHISDIVQLTMLWILCSIPLITIGASSTAVYYVSLKIIKGEEVDVKSAFFKSFKNNIVQSTIVWLLFCIITVFFAINYRYLYFVSTDKNTFLKALIIIATIIYACCFVYALPLIARYVNTLKKIITNSFVLSLKYLDITVRVVLLYGIFLVIGFYSLPVGIIAYVICAPSIYYIITAYMVRIYEFLESGKVEEDKVEDSSVEEKREEFLEDDKSENFDSQEDNLEEKEVKQSEFDNLEEKEVKQSEFDNLEEKEVEQSESDLEE